MVMGGRKEKGQISNSNAVQGMLTFIISDGPHGTLNSADATMKASAGELVAPVGQSLSNS